MWTDKLAFIGAGNIAQIIMDRLIDVGSLAAGQIFACDNRFERRAYLRENYRGMHTSEDPREAAGFSKCIVLATPAPAVLPVLREIRPVLTRDHLVLCLATSVSLGQLEAVLGEVPVVRGMVNTPSLVGEGMNLIAFGRHVSPEFRRRIAALFDLFGPKFEVSDEQMDFWCAICGAGPTYVLPVIEALARAAMARGISHEQAMVGSSQVVLGAARMVQQTGRDPADLEKLSASLSSLQEDEVHRLYTQAYEDTLHKLNEAAVLAGVGSDRRRR